MISERIRLSSFVALVLTACVANVGDKSEADNFDELSAQVSTERHGAAAESFALQAHASASDTPSDVGALRWSDPATWPSGRVPAPGEAVTIPADTKVILDVSPPALGGLTVHGTLTFDDTDLKLSARWIMVHGTMQIGSSDRPYTHRGTITLTGDDPAENIMGMGTRGIMVMGGALELHGQAPVPTWTRLSAHAAAGATTLTFSDPVNWAQGDQLAIAPTDFYEVGGTEVLTVRSRANRRVTLIQPLQRARWGRLQYVANDGVTLTPTTTVTRSVIDERAEVANLTRNIVIEGADDALWRTEAFGAHVMFMNGATVHVDGVQLQRVGQAGRLGRYPLHWHLMSYDASGRELGDLTGQYVRNSVVSGSSQRCMVIHATNGLTLEHNICHDIKGHAFFLEDAVERRNILQGNLALRMRVPDAGKALQNHETFAGETTGPSGFWLTNPDNTIRNNAAADADGMGFWLAYPAHALGLSRAVRIEPQHTPFGVFDNNVTHSNLKLGFQIDNAPINDAGDTTGMYYVPVEGGFAGDGTPEAPFVVSRLVSFKNKSALWNRVRRGTFTDFVVADFHGVGFKGSSQQCMITKAIVAGTTLNHVTRPEDGTVSRVGAASYHSECQINENIFVNLPAILGRPSGAFETSDYYITGVDMGLVNNVNNVFVNTHPGYRTPSMNLLPVGAGRENWSLAGALWDPHGLWGAAGNYWVYDLPFLTDGTSCTDVRQPVHGNDKSCVGPYYGFAVDIWEPRDPGSFVKPIHYHRNDNNTDFFVDDGACTWRLGVMRYASMIKNGSYTVTFPAGQNADDGGTCAPSQLAPDTPAPRSLTFTVTNLHEAEDGFLVSVEYEGSLVPTVYRTSWPNPREMVDFQWDSWTSWKAGDPNWKSKFRGEFFQPLTRMSSLEEVQAANGNGYWQDSARNLVWILVRRTGLQPLNAEPYQTVHFVLSNQY